MVASETKKWPFFARRSDFPPRLVFSPSTNDGVREISWKNNNKAAISDLYLAFQRIVTPIRGTNAKSRQSGLLSITSTLRSATHSAVCAWWKHQARRSGWSWRTPRKAEGSAMSVGLLAVPLQYGLYVFGHLSKWFVFVLMFKFWSVYRLWNGRPTIGYNSLLTAIRVIRQQKQIYIKN